MNAPVESSEMARAASRDFGSALQGGEPPWLQKFRRDGFARFTDLGLPTVEREEWKYTSVAPIARLPFRRERAAARGVTASRIAPFSLRSAGAIEIVFVNGRFDEGLSAFDPSRQDVRVGSLRRRLAEEPEGLERYLERGLPLSEEQNAFAALNAALFEDGACVEISRGQAVREPVHLLFFCSPDREPTAVYPRTLVLAGAGSQATIVETYAGDASEPSLTDAVTEVFLEDGALVDYVKLESESRAAFHLAATAVWQARASRFAAHAVSLGGALVRDDIRVVLAEEGAECALNGLFMGDETQHIDNHTLIDHARPHGTSRELYKGIMSGRSRGVFHGKIIVRQDAQKSDAIQTNKNLLLSREALVNSTPALEILADDVKCKHGATTGQLDPAALFYLRSRGIGEEAARALLVYAFASDLIGRIPVAMIRARIEDELGVRLPGVREIKEAVA
jgi:Fe-S cluster assembly protein SufD